MASKRYKIEAITETYLELEEMVQWLKDRDFHTIQVTEIDD